MLNHAPYILPTGERMNPAQPQDACYFDIGQTAIIMRRLDEDRSRPTRVFTTFGDETGWELGTQHDCRHDQTGARLGIYEVVGIHQFSTGRKVGVVPDRKLSHSVFK